MNGAKVLVIEDWPAWRKQLTKKLQKKNIELVWAESEGKARKRLLELNNGGRLQVDAVVISACLGNHQTPTSLINEILSSFSGEIIGTSEQEAFQDRLQKAGCHHVCDHASLPQMLLCVLGL